MCSSEIRQPKTSSPQPMLHLLVKGNGGLVDQQRITPSVFTDLLVISPSQALHLDSRTKRSPSQPIDQENLTLSPSTAAIVTVVNIATLDAEERSRSAFDEEFQSRLTPQLVWVGAPTISDLLHRLHPHGRPQAHIAGLSPRCDHIQGRSRLQEFPVLHNLGRFYCTVRPPTRPFCFSMNTK